MAGLSGRNLRGSGRNKKLVEVWNWHSDPKRTQYCKQCGKYKKTPHKCRSCEYGQGPILREENLDAWELWNLAQTQWRASGFGLVGLDYNAMLKMADLAEIPLTIPTLHKIQALEGAVLESQNKKGQNHGV